MIDLERLRYEMKRQGMSQAVLASAVEASPAAIQQILNGKTRQTRLASRIAKTLGVSLEWLEGEDVDPARLIKVSSAEKDFESSVFLYFGRDEQQKSDGSIFQRMLVLSSYWADEVFGSNVGEEIIIFRVTTRDMAPTLLPGDDVAVRSESAFDGSPDSIWFFQFQDRTYIRRLNSVRDDTLTCVADNPAFPPFELPASEVVIRGRVVWQGRSLTP